VLPESLARVLALPESARVLDLGGWAAPLNRADWVIDAMPYGTRGAIAPHGVGPGPPRFTEGTWITRDLCDREPYPFDDDFFDFAVCTFTLEDLRDPVGVCREMSRVAKAGYVEVPSLVDELSWQVREPSGGPWLGHDHHLWFCIPEESGLAFLKKLHSLHSNPRVRVPSWRARTLPANERVFALFWEGSLPAREWLSIESYPVGVLERAVRDRFRISRPELAAIDLTDRARRARHRAFSLLRRSLAHGR